MSSEFPLQASPISLANQASSQGLEALANVHQYLRFSLLPDTTAMLPVNQMTEVLNIALDGIVPIPHMPSWTMGVYNWRGEVLWLVDLGHLVGLTPIYQERNSRSYYSAIVIHHHHIHQEQKSIARKTIGLIVDRVEDMEWCNPDWIQSSLETKVNAQLVPFLRGFWLKENSEILVVLDGNSIIANMPQS
jgi:positive phototaxis protein PixI